jgi:branched-chain amino acid transport system substrate-binding protein
MTQDSISTYGDIWIFKDALEHAKVADRKKVAEAIRAMDTTDGPARFFPGGRLKFEDNGRRSGAALLIVQWQNGEPKVVYPPASALAKPMWSKK